MSDKQTFEFINTLFFRIYSFTPDPSIANFVNEHSNLLYSFYSNNGGEWIIYPHREFKSLRIIHSIYFNNHPLIFSEFDNGLLEVVNLEFEDDPLQTQELILNIFFGSKSNGLKAIGIIDESMSKLNCRKREQCISKCLMVEYSSDIEGMSKGLSYKFGKDIFENRYRLIIYPRTNKIHFIS